MIAQAFAQALVGVIALVAGLNSARANWPGAIVVLTGFFATLWLVSAWLFRKAAQLPQGRTRTEACRMPCRDFVMLRVEE